jgi:hypothetical protein
MYVILSDLKANKNFQGLYGIAITVTIAIILIVGSSLPYALSRSFSILKTSHPYLYRRAVAVPVIVVAAYQS